MTILNNKESMRVTLKSVTVPSIPLAALLVIACSGLWFSSYWGARLALFPNQTTEIVNHLQKIIVPNTLLSEIISFFLTLLNAFLLAQINNKFTIIRTRTFLPILVFMTLMGTWNETHLVNGSHISLTLFILSLFSFFSMSRNRNSSEQAFMGSFLISISSILINPLIFLIPVCWIGFGMFQSLSLKTFLASLMGSLTPWILYLALNFIINPHFNVLQALILNPNFILDIATYSLPDLVYFALMSIIIIMGIVGLYSTAHSDAIDTRNKLNFLVFLLISLCVICFIFINQFVSFLPIIALVYALLFSHPLTLKQNNFHSILFIVFCVINLVYAVSKYILT